MFSRIRRRLTYTNVAMTLALVFAMSGGAYAAGRYVITSTKQISPKVLKSLQGKAGKAGANGAAGATGSQGPAGANGKDGVNGTNGANGSNGVGVTSSVEPKGANCKEGGSKFVAASGTTYACNGATGFTETLPAGKTEVGAWFISGPPKYAPFETTIARSSISFVIPLASEPTAHFLKEGEGETAECPGKATNPQAAPGNLCVYEEGGDGVEGELTVNAHTYGAIMAPVTAAQPGGVASGSWAVTAEEE